MVQIRECRKSDQNGIMEVCFRTGYMGEDATGHFRDKKLFGDLFCLYYPRYEHENCFVAEHKGQIVGYILGSPDTNRQERLFLVKMGWRILLRAFLITFWFYHQDFKTVMHFLRLPHTAPPKDLPRRYPAHLHIDILAAYQHKGTGSQLMARFEGLMRKFKVHGIHLGTSEGNLKAIPFYKKHGYRILHTDPFGMWPDAPEKRGVVFAKRLES
jgi:GNAT superfamily N-acetyltransferase